MLVQFRVWKDATMDYTEWKDCSEGYAISFLHMDSGETKLSIKKRLDSGEVFNCHGYQFRKCNGS